MTPTPVPTPVGPGVSGVGVAGAGGGVVISAATNPRINVEDLDEDLIVFTPADRGVQGPPGAGVELRRQGTSGVIEWRQKGQTHWAPLIDLADGIVAVAPIPPTFVIGTVTTVTDIANVGVSVTQPDPMNATYVLAFRLLQGPAGRDGRNGKNGQPRFSGQGLPDPVNFPDAEEGDLYLDETTALLYKFHPEP